MNSRIPQVDDLSREDRLDNLRTTGRRPSIGLPPGCHKLAQFAIVLVLSQSSAAWALSPSHAVRSVVVPSHISDRSSPSIRSGDSMPSESTLPGSPSQPSLGDSLPLAPAGLRARADVVPPAAPLSAGPDFSATMTSLRGAAMGMIKGCNYARYLSLADSLATAMQTFRSLEGGPPGTTWAVPFLDPISMLFRSAATMAARKTAQAAHDGLAYQLEQVCNSVVQADQVSRQVQLLTAAAQNIEHPIRWLMQELNLGITHVPGAEQAHIQANWARLYTNAAPHTGSPSDTMWEAIDTTLRVTLAASGEMHTALDSLVGQLQQTEQEMVLFASPDSLDPTRYDCPAGYPDPNRPDVAMVGTQRVCGPATPERQAQITAHLDLLKTQIRALQVSATARDLEVESVGLMADNEGRKITNLNRNASVLAF